jgi:tetratricopeptide (TPR) repeat protein
VVQSHTDSESCSLDDAEEAERQLAEPVDRTEGDARLLGAIGRAYAAVGNYSRALQRLREAVAEWRELDQLQQASYAVCELVRVLGVGVSLQRHHAAGLFTGPSFPACRPSCLDELHRVIAEDMASVLAHPMLSDESAGFLLLAKARALAQAGDERAAADALAAVLARPCDPPHLRFAAYRWALRIAAANPGAQQLRDSLDKQDDDDARVQAALSRLDALVLPREPPMARQLAAAGDTPDILLDQLSSMPGGWETRRLRRRLAGSGLRGRELELHFVEEYRY